MSFPFPISPSQINCIELCERKYGWEYIEGVESEPGDAAKIGIEMHRQLENWFRDSTVPDDTLPGLMAQELILKWPAPGQVDRVEQHIHVQTEKAWYHGYKDIGFSQKFKDKVSKSKIHLRVVGDHKSTSDLKWAKTPEELLRDPQSIIYSAAEMEEHKVDEVLDKWAYVTRSKKPKTKIVQTILTREQVELGFDRLDVLAQRIYEIRAIEGLKAMDLEPTVTACGAFGGCSHVARCTDLTPQKRMRAFMAQQTLREKILAKKAEKEAAEGKLGPKPEAAPEAKPQTAKKADVKKEEKPPATTKAAPASRLAAKAAQKPDPKPEPEEDPGDLPDELPETDVAAAECQPATMRIRMPVSDNRGVIVGYVTLAFEKAP
jgi:hypothetical protein